MTIAIPIDALVARADRAADVVAPQYDAVPGGRYRFATDRPDSFVNITLSLSDFPEPSPTRAQIARRAADHFAGMMERDLFEALPRRAFFLYGLDTDGHQQVGLVCALPLSCITRGEVLGHEGTIPRRVEDLSHFFRVCRLASSPVALAFSASDEQRRLLDRLSSRPPIRDFEGLDGVRQRLWMVDDPSDIIEVERATSRINTLYVTDGHHRVAASTMHGVGPGWILSILFPSDELKIFDYNRLVRLEEIPPVQQVLQSLGKDWDVTVVGEAGEVDATPAGRGDMSMLLEGVWYRLCFRGGRPSDPVKSLDVSLLHDLILGPVFGVPSYHDPRLSYVVGKGSLRNLENAALTYSGSVGFALHPVQIDEIMAVADAGRLMPPKSTWFAPKPRSGMLVVRWDQDHAGATTSPAGASSLGGGSW